MKNVELFFLLVIRFQKVPKFVKSSIPNFHYSDFSHSEFFYNFCGTEDIAIHDRINAVKSYDGITEISAYIDFSPVEI